MKTSATASFTIPATNAGRLRAVHPASRGFWRIVQYLGLLGGMGLFVTLLFMPALGLHILWNILIPVAPVLVAVAPGLWRNLCPMATLSLLPRNLGFSRKAIPSRQAVRILTATSLVGLLVVIPLRHLSLNTDGTMSALMLLVAGGAAFLAGRTYEWRSGWCNSLCPIHSVEKLYAQSPAVTLTNQRCDQCSGCTVPCPDSTRAMTPTVTGASVMETAMGHVMAGGFAGFVWGWFQIPDYSGPVGAGEIIGAYAWPVAGALASLAVYAVAYHGWGRHSVTARRTLTRVFAALAVGSYYWFRIPALVGFGPHPGSGMLWDLSAELPNLPLVSHALTSLFFAWFLVVRPLSLRAWMERPVRAPRTAS